MDIAIGDKLVMKKQHPCGNNIFAVKRIGMDFKLCCIKCNHEIMISRKKAEKGIKRIIRQGENI
ncbi:MAG: DUF951 domain-containing protein [Clostridia bacterium]|nr:DUF951 domain-containing protein [Clostridia bacterium]